MSDNQSQMFGAKLKIKHLDTDDSIEVIGVPTIFLPTLEKNESPVEPYVLFFDIGGTKVLAEILDAKGRVVETVFEPSLLTHGPNGLIEQIGRLGLPLKEKYRVKKIEISSAGPLDPTKGLWLNPTNLKTDGKHWGVVDVVGPLKKTFGCDDLTLENDAAAQAVLMHRYHPTSQNKDFLLLTLGTGVGVAIIKNGRLVRDDIGLHPELSHLPLYSEIEIKAAKPKNEADSLDVLKFWNQLNYPRLCGCGKQGCMETYLAGSHFDKSNRPELQRQLMKEVFLPRVVKQLCQQFELHLVFVSGNFGRFLFE